MASTADRVATGTPLEDLDTQGVMRRIPHRYPMLLVDRVTRMEAFHKATGIKQVTINEPFFQGHFPNDPIMPGVLVIEAMAQTAAVLILASLGSGYEGNLVYFMGVDEARFRRPIRPGMELRLEVQVQRSRLSVYRFEGRAMTGDQLAAEAVFSAKMMGV